MVILPPVAAIVLAILTRQVILSLFLGVWMGWTCSPG
jgi:Na+/H+ antiporter NhaC